MNRCRYEILVNTKKFCLDVKMCNREEILKKTDFFALWSDFCQWFHRVKAVQSFYQVFLLVQCYCHSIFILYGILNCQALALSTWFRQKAQVPLSVGKVFEVQVDTERNDIG